MIRASSKLMAWALAAVLCQPAFAELTELEKPEYEETRNLSLEILRRYPPSEYHYVTLGSSLVPIQAFLEAILPANVTNLPLSNMYNRPEPSNVKGFDPPLDAAAEKRLFDHFDRFLPPERIGRKKLLVLDFAEGGGSMVAAEEYLSKHFGPMPDGSSRIHPVILRPGDSLPMMEAAGKFYDTIPLAPYRWLKTRMMMLWYKTGTRHGKFAPPFDNPPPAEPLPGYKKVLANVANRIAQDTYLSRQEICSLMLGIIFRP